MVTWDLNKFPYEQPQFIRDRRGKVLRLNLDVSFGNRLTITFTVRNHSLISALEKTYPETATPFSGATGLYVPLCPQEETLRGLFFAHTVINIENMIEQCIMSKHEN